MNIINAGGMYKVYGESVKTYERLPVKTYQVAFSKMEGFSLTERNDLKVTEEKVYGNSVCKAKKVMKSFGLTDRNFGVLLSGQKGIGKSLFLRILAEEAICAGIPVIVVTEPYPGIANFISSIDQECAVVFDEFEKTFVNNEEHSTQDDLLSLFDGLDGGHKLFVVTCNELDKVSKYMINRPGRFHYHFSMVPPTPDEVQEYMTDKLKPEYHGYIHDIVNLSNIIDMPYDYLRAIVFEVNQGYSLKEAMSDLNITRDDNTFDVVAYLSNGMTMEAFDESIDLSSNETSDSKFRRYVRDNAPKFCWIYYFANRAVIKNKEFVVPEEYIIQPHWESGMFEGNDDETERMAQEWNRSVRVERIVLKKIKRHRVQRYDV